MVKVNGERCMVNGEQAPKSTLSQAALGRALGLSPAAITKLKGQGMPVDSVEAAQAWREARQNVAARKPVPVSSTRAETPVTAPWPFPPLYQPDPGMPPPDRHGMADELGEDRDAARTRREISEANMAEMNEARLRRELIRVSVVQAQLGTDYATLREAMLQIPARMAPKLAAESDPAAIQTALHAEIHQALQEMAGVADKRTHLEGAFD